MRKGFLTALVLLLLLVCAAASAETKITVSPENPRVGDYVDVVVAPGKDGAKAVRYTLSTPAGTVFEGEEDKHFKASFRPRTEAVYTLTVTVSYGKKDVETASVTVPVSGAAPEQAGPDVVYSQKDGWWHDKVYSKTEKRSVEKSGCALFALSHALQRMGHTGADVQPDHLAKTYSNMYIKERGTDNERLLKTAGEAYGFQTHEDLIESEAELTVWLRQGCYFSFEIAKGHIAMADGLSEDGTKVHVVDSATGATFERIKKGTIYYQKEDGSFAEAATPEDLPGNRYFFETGEYGGMAYWLNLSYCARKGMRPIRNPWMTTEDGAAAEPEYAGAMVTRVSVAGGEPVRVNTRDLHWTTQGADDPTLALVTKKGGVSFVDGNGKKKEGFGKKIAWGTMLPVLAETEKQWYVFYRGKFGFIDKKGAQALPVEQDEFRTGLVSLNGRTAGTTPVNFRMDGTAKSSIVGDWKPGTPVALVEKKGEFWLAEGKGRRGWIHEKYITAEGADTDGQKVDEGE